MVKYTITPELWQDIHAYGTSDPNTISGLFFNIVGMYGGGEEQEVIVKDHYSPTYWRGFWSQEGADGEFITYLYTE